MLRRADRAQRKYKVDETKLRLVFAGAALSDDVGLRDYGVVAESAVMVILKGPVKLLTDFSTASDTASESAGNDTPTLRLLDT